MFGGLAFLVRGHICVAASRTGSLLTRVGSPAERDAVLQIAHLRPMIMGSKMVDRFVYIDPPGLGTDETLRGWIERSLAAIAQLPAKKTSTRKASVKPPR